MGLYCCPANTLAVPRPLAVLDKYFTAPLTCSTSSPILTLSLLLHLEKWCNQKGVFPLPPLPNYQHLYPHILPSLPVTCKIQERSNFSLILWNTPLLGFSQGQRWYVTISNTQRSFLNVLDFLNVLVFIQHLMNWLPFHPGNTFFRWLLGHHALLISS